ncbi:hypothetical protein NOR_04414 [Metarhizium rileyi]|uniref:Uncharacterized protein n=1 Tax=Metarhizium rileyi (strain RCEF 4871) TaxID=1649241 RepID=A0A167EFI5_METRR|nr:hypothetical protein NOR_04414 [Metarhizium rileyi RCEF 4871]
MMPKSFAAARATVRDFFRSSLSYRRRSKRSLWRERVDEWGRQMVKEEEEVSQVESEKKTSDDTFFTSWSVQSNMTDVPIASTESAIIKDGPQRTVDVQQVSMVSEFYPQLDNDIKSSGAMLPTGTAERIPQSPSRPQTHLNHPQPRPKETECQIQTDQYCNDSRRCKSSDWKITDSTLFAYHAMSGCSYAEKTKLYTWLKGHHGNCGPESDCSLLIWKLEARNFDSARTDEDERNHGRVLSVSRPSLEAASRWADKTEPRSNFATDYVNTEIHTGLHDVYVSDSEESGRISPNTFRLWTTNCARAQDETRQRTASHAVPDTRNPGPYTSDEPVEPTPDDSTLSSISSIPPDKHHEILAWQHKMSLHAAAPTAATSSHRQRNKVYTLTLPQVQSALSHPLAPPTIHTVPISEYTSALNHRASFLDSSEAHMSKLARTRSDLHDQIAALQGTLDSITTHAGNIMRRRHPLHTEADRWEQSERDDIYAYLEDYMCRLGTECDARHEKLHRLAHDIDRLKEREADLRTMIEATGETVDVGVEEVNGDVDEMERLVRLIDEGEMELSNRQGD